MSLPGGIARPIVAVAIEGPVAVRLVDGLLDTGADRTIFPRREAQSVGINLPRNSDGHFRTAGGVSISYRLAEAQLELRSGTNCLRWRTVVAFADDPLSIIHLGNRGFLEFFHCTFQGPEKKVLLSPRPVLPRP